jgi:hypothetical protein
LPISPKNVSFSSKGQKGNIIDLKGKRNTYLSANTNKLAIHAFIVIIISCNEPLHGCPLVVVKIAQKPLKSLSH